MKIEPRQIHVTWDFGLIQGVEASPASLVKIEANLRGLAGLKDPPIWKRPSASACERALPRPSMMPAGVIAAAGTAMALRRADGAGRAAGAALEHQEA
jgi:hypothetical protein